MAQLQFQSEPLLKAITIKTIRGKGTGFKIFIVIFSHLFARFKRKSARGSADNIA